MLLQKAIVRPKVLSDVWPEAVPYHVGLCLRVLTTFCLACHSEKQIQERRRNSEAARAKVKSRSLSDLISEVTSHHHRRFFCLLELGPAHDQGEGVTDGRNTRRQGSLGGHLRGCPLPHTESWSGKICGIQLNKPELQLTSRPTNEK